MCSRLYVVFVRIYKKEWLRDFRMISPPYRARAGFEGGWAGALALIQAILVKTPRAKDKVAGQLCLYHRDRSSLKLQVLPSLRNFCMHFVYAPQGKAEVALTS